MKHSLAQEILLNSYALVRRSGLLNTSVGSTVFTAAYFLYKHYEDDLDNFVQRYPGLLRGGNALDIGANIGYTAQILARAIDPGRVVHAFEPEPSNFRLLGRVAGRSEFARKIVAHNCAVGAHDGTVQLWLNQDHPADHRVITEQFQETGKVSGLTVPVTSVDSFLASNPGPVALIKIDVQGFELPVCEGMRMTLEKNPDVSIVLEYAPSGLRALGFNPADLLGFLTGHGFRCYSIGPEGKLSAGLPSALRDSDYVDLLFSRHSVLPGTSA